MSTYLGWLMPWGSPLTLLGRSVAEVAAAQRDLVRIGIDRVQSAATGGPEAWASGEPLARYEVTDFAGYARARGQREFILLDVRRQSEWETARIADAVHIPLHDLAGRDGRGRAAARSGCTASLAIARRWPPGCSMPRDGTWC